MKPEPLYYSLSVVTPLGDYLIFDMIYISCIVKTLDEELFVDNPLDMLDFDIILGMDWLASYHATVDYYEKTATFQLLDVNVSKFEGVRETCLSCFILRHAKWLLQKGCQGFIAFGKTIVQEKLNHQLCPLYEKFLMYSKWTAMVATLLRGWILYWFSS